MILSVAGGVVLGLCLRAPPEPGVLGRSVARTLIVFPLMVAPVVASIMIAWIFNDQFGVANAILGVLGFPPVPWLVKPMLGLLDRDPHRRVAPDPVLRADHPGGAPDLLRQPHEAARVDGANAWQVFRNVTLPFLRPVLPWPS